MKRVYLSGPITGLSYNGCTDWRRYFASLLKPDVVPLSPMRGKEYLAAEENIKDAYKSEQCVSQSPAALALSCSAGITAKDRNDVFNCDAMVVHLLGAKQISIGTVVEFGWADAFRKPIISIIENDGSNVHEHSIVNTVTGFRVPTLEDAVHLVNILLSDEFAFEHQ
jgi:nucleoside 2-deoxyribosyltransferase